MNYGNEINAIKPYLNNQEAKVKNYTYSAFHYTQYDEENDEVRQMKITENYNQADPEECQTWILNWDEVKSLEEKAKEVGKEIVEGKIAGEKNTENAISMLNDDNNNKQLTTKYNLYSTAKLSKISELTRVQNILGNQQLTEQEKIDEIYKIIGKRAIKDYLLKDYANDKVALGPGKDLSSDPTSGLSNKIKESLKYEAFYETLALYDKKNKFIPDNIKSGKETDVKKLIDNYKKFTKVFQKNVDHDVDNYKIYTVGYGEILQTDKLYSGCTGDTRNITIETSDGKLTGGTYQKDGANLSTKNYSIHIDDDAQGNKQIYLGNNISYGAKLDIKITLKEATSNPIEDIAGIISDDNKIFEMRELTYNGEDYWGYIDFNKMCEKLAVSAADLNGATLSITNYNPKVNTSIYSVNPPEYSLCYVLMKHILPQNGGKYEPAVKDTTGGNVTIGSNYKDLTSVLVDIFKDVSQEEEVDIGDMLDEQLGIMINKGASVNIDIQFATEENRYNFDIQNVDENTEINGYKIINQYNENLYINLNNLAKALGKNDILDFIGAHMCITY